MKSIVITIVLLLATNASACDRFAYWRYSFKQRCDQRAWHEAHRYHTPFRVAARIAPPAVSEEAQALVRLRDAMIRSTWP